MKKKWITTYKWYIPSSSQSASTPPGCRHTLGALLIFLCLEVRIWSCMITFLCWIGAAAAAARHTENKQPGVMWRHTNTHSENQPPSKSALHFLLFYMFICWQGRVHLCVSFGSSVSVWVSDEKQTTTRTCLVLNKETGGSRWSIWMY